MRWFGRSLVLLVVGASASCAPMPPVQPPEDPSALLRELPSPADPSPETANPEVIPAPAHPAALSVHEVRMEGAARALVIGLSGAPEGMHEFTLSGPPRLVIDLEGDPAPEKAGGARFPVEDDLVTGVRTAPRGRALRVVVDLRHLPRHHAVRQEGAQLIADFGEGAGTKASATPVLLPVLAAEGAESADTAPAAVAEADPPADPADPAAPPLPAPPPVALVTPTPPPAPKPIAPAGAAPVYTGQPISLDMKDADIQNVLRVIADVSGLNIVATDDVKGKVTLHLTNVPWDQVLDLVLTANRLEKTREGNVIRISTVTRLKDEREALRAAQDAAREVEPVRVRYVKVNYARADEALVNKVKGVLTERGSVTFDDRTNTIVIRDINRGIDDAAELVKQLDSQSPQVLIEASIVEATEDFARGLGVQWGYGFKAGPQTGNPTGMNFPGTVGLGGSSSGTGIAPPIVPGVPGTNVARSPLPFLADFPVPSSFGSGFGGGNGSTLDLALGSIDGTQSLTARLTALEEQGKGKVISRPRVITMNNVAATIQSLTILRVKLPSTGTVINTGAGGAAGSASTATEKINTGITLVVTPQVSQDGFVLMSIYAKSSQADFTKSVDNIPAEVSREANSNVLVPNGETVVLGGIFRRTADDRESGIPYLSRVPALGWLFKRVLRNHHHEELLVFITPRVVSNGGGSLPSAAKLWEERRPGG